MAKRRRKGGWPKVKFKNKFPFVSLSGGSRSSHASFMVNTLAPDLRRSGHKYTARDVAKCGRLMLRGKKNRSYASWLKSTLIPDLRASGRVETAKDLARCARAIGRR